MYMKIGDFIPCWPIGFRLVLYSDSGTNLGSYCTVPTSDSRGF